MNVKCLSVACVFAALSSVVISAQADTSPPLAGRADIQKVLSMTQDASPTCGIVNAQMTYLNAQGQTQTLHYRRFADSCDTTN